MTSRKPKYNIAGMTFGRLTVVDLKERLSTGAYLWRCVCSCGNERLVDTTRLRSGHTKSCGCLSAETTAERSRSHGHATRDKKSGAYKAWECMKTRCNNANNKRYARYGGRGIKICERWSEFENFIEDMGERPDGMTLDRINVDGDYEPGNCRWATQKMQARNTSRSKMVTLNGETKCFTEWAEIYGISEKAVRSRLRYGWNIEDAFSRKVSK